MSAEPPPRALASGSAGLRAAFASPALRGIALMFVSTFFFAAMHGSIRYMSETIHPFEIALFRNVFALVVVLPWFYRYGIAPLRTQRFGLHALRAVFNIMAMLSFFYALSITPLSEVTALGFTAPIFATVLAALILREVVRARRWIAIAIGFLGTLIILRPGFEAIGLGQILVLFSSMIWACALLVIQIPGADRQQRHDHLLHGALDDPTVLGAGAVRVALAGPARMGLADRHRRARRHRPVLHDRGATAGGYRRGHAV